MTRLQIKKNEKENMANRNVCWIIWNYTLKGLLSRQRRIRVIRH